MSWRTPFAQLIENLRERQPFRDVDAELKAPAELCAGDCQGGLTAPDLIVRGKLSALGDIHHFLERKHLDLELVGIAADEVLSRVGLIEATPVRVIARAGVIPAHDEMRRAEVAPDDG